MNASLRLCPALFMVLAAGRPGWAAESDRSESDTAGEQQRHEQGSDGGVDAATPEGAEGTEESTAVVPSQPPSDVIVFNNGSMIRGTITEIIAGEYVEIISVDGERKRYLHSEVAYAGPASDMPRPSASAVPAQQPGTAGTVPVELRATGSGEVTYHVRSVATDSGVSPYQGGTTLCTAPCVVHLAPGVYRFDVTGPTGHKEQVETPFRITGPATLVATYDSNRGTRVAGWVILGVGSFAGLLVIGLTGAEGDAGPIVAGIGLIGASVTIGVALGTTGDRARIDVPGSSTSSTTAGGAGLRGIRLRLAF